MNLRVRGSRVLVALPPAPKEVTTDSGLVLVRDPDLVRAPTRGIVAQLGQKRGHVLLDDVLAALNEAERHDDWQYDETVERITRLSHAPFAVQVGDCVLFPPSSGEEVHMDGIDYVILDESEILGTVDPLTKDTTA